jgi:hypothetical protein
MKIARLSLLIVILILSACSSDREPTATVSATPTAPTIAATPTMEPTATPTVTPTMAAPAESPATPTAEPTAQPSPTAVPTATPAPPEPAPAAGPCQHPYYPVVAGASWEYQLSGTSSDTFVRSITHVRENGFDDQDDFSAGVTRRGSWECREGNLIDLALGSSPAVTVTGEEMNFTFDVESNTGITLPANPQPGMEWMQKIVYRGQFDMGGTNLEGRNVVDLSCQAIGLETVHVPAGDFNALRVDCTTKLDIAIAGTAAFNTTITGSSWYAPGVGWVKSRDSGDMGVTEIVLVSYTIP